MENCEVARDRRHRVINWVAGGRAQRAPRGSLASQFALLVVLLALATTVRAAEPSLGDLTFPTSGDPTAQASFERAVKLLHNFEYNEAADAFRKCQEIDKQFAMAYWGEAMCHNHPLWGEQDRKAAVAVLARLQAVHAPKRTEVEAAFIDSLGVLFGSGDKLQRDREYASRLGELAAQFPNHQEVACFHALALLGACRGRDQRVYMQAAAILEDVYRENARHPGVLHYLIHCYDDPVHAPLGLRAARTYASVAGNSAHAQHMPSHIFFALGRWQDVIQANTRAWEAGQRRITRLGLGSGDYDIHAFHAIQWLHYALLQVGDHEAATKLLHQARDILEQNPSPTCKWYTAMMLATHLVHAHLDDDPPEFDFDIDLTGIEPSAQANLRLARALATERSTPASALQDVHHLLVHAKGHVGTGGHHDASFFTSVHESSVHALQVIESQLHAMVVQQRGDSDAAIARFEAAAKLEEQSVSYGPPSPVKPSRELLAELLVEVGRAQEATEHLQHVLIRHPRRALPLHSLTEAAELKKQ